MQFFKSFPLCKYFKTFFREWVKESICWLWDFEEVKIKGRPTWLLCFIIIIVLLVIGENDFLYTQIWPWSIIKWLIVPFFFLTLMTLCTKKYQKIEELEAALWQKNNLLEIKERKIKLQKSLEIILNKYDDFHYQKSPYPRIFNEHPAYKEILELLQQSDVVLPKIASHFKDGTLPKHLKNRFPSFDLMDTRWRIVDSLRDDEKENFTTCIHNLRKLC